MYIYGRLGLSNQIESQVPLTDNDLILMQGERLDATFLAQPDGTWAHPLPNRIVEKQGSCRQMAGAYILVAYPAMVQSQINSLTGYSQHDKDVMWDFIQRVEAYCTICCTNCGNCQNITDLNNVAMDFSGITPNQGIGPIIVTQGDATWLSGIIKLTVIFLGVFFAYAASGQC